MWIFLRSPITALSLAAAGIGVSLAYATRSALVGAAICFTIAAILILAENTRLMKNRQRSRATGSTIAIAVSVALLSSYFWLYERADAQTPTPPSGNCNIGRDNNGTFICNSTLDATPAPQLEPVSEDKMESRPDGTYMHHWIFNVNSPYPAGRVEVWAYAPNIKYIIIGQIGSGAQISGPYQIRQDYAYGVIPNPYGQIGVDVQTKTQDPVKLNYRIQ